MNQMSRFLLWAPHFVLRNISSGSPRQEVVCPSKVETRWTRFIPDSNGDIFAQPQIPDVDGQVRREADVGPAGGDRGGRVTEIQQNDGDVPVGEQFAPDLRGRTVAHNDALDP